MINSVDAARSFSPIEGPNARVLVLGSMPGRQSLQAQQYYAHPQNAFWPIMAEVVGFSSELAYEGRVEALRRGRVAVWDVFAACERPGSLDADIVAESIVMNDLAAFLRRQPGLRLIACNGRKAGQAWQRFAKSAAKAPPEIVLPSTSPAYAAMPRSEKLASWRTAIEAALRA